MIDTFHPLHLTKQASALEDDRYPFSWIPPEDSGEHARELSERGTGGLPGLTRWTTSVLAALGSHLASPSRQLAQDVEVEVGRVLDLQVRPGRLDLSEPARVALRQGHRRRRLH